MPNCSLFVTSFVETTEWRVGRRAGGTGAAGGTGTGGTGADLVLTLRNGEAGAFGAGALPLQADAALEVPEESEPSLLELELEVLDLELDRHDVLLKSEHSDSLASGRLFAMFFDLAFAARPAGASSVGTSHTSSSPTKTSTCSFRALFFGRQSGSSSFAYVGELDRCGTAFL